MVLSLDEFYNQLKVFESGGCQACLLRLNNCVIPPDFFQVVAVSSL